MTRLYLALAVAAAMLGGCETTAKRSERPIVGGQPAGVMLGGPYKTVFFRWNSATLEPESHAIVQDFAISIKSLEISAIELRGHADRSGPSAYNHRLSLRRANAVKAALIALGLTSVKIVVIAEGEHAPLVPTPDGVREPQNRFVTLGEAEDEGHQHSSTE
ncbi:OmpA family protein [Oleomonas cavernae]|nr:OmpA family protein [Oleomonas cavernae]